MRIKLLVSAVLMAFSMGTVLTIYWLSEARGIAGHGFDRTMSGNVPTLLSSVKLSRDAYYFAGGLQEKSYLADPDAPFEIIEVDGTVLRTIHVKNLPNLKVKTGRITIDSPYFYLADLYSYSVYRGRTGTWALEKRMHGSPFFSEAVPISPLSMVMRTLNRNKDAYVITKKHADAEIAVTSENFLQKQIDGLFCTDGMLLFDKDANRIVYTYYYRNQFICADTNLNVALRANTIDTISHARIKVANISSTGVSTLASPPFIVNRATFTSDGILYVNSRVIADNEDPDDFNSSDVIDLYETATGDYVISFYIPRPDKERLRNFAVRSGLLYVLRGNTLSIYDISDWPVNAQIDSLTVQGPL